MYSIIRTKNWFVKMKVEIRNGKSAYVNQNYVYNNNVFSYFDEWTGESIPLYVNIFPDKFEFEFRILGSDYCVCSNFHIAVGSKDSAFGGRILHMLDIGEYGRNNAPKLLLFWKGKAVTQIQDPMDFVCLGEGYLVGTKSRIDEEDDDDGDRHGRVVQRLFFQRSEVNVRSQYHHRIGENVVLDLNYLSVLPGEFLIYKMNKIISWRGQSFPEPIRPDDPRLYGRDRDHRDEFVFDLEGFSSQIYILETMLKMKYYELLFEFNKCIRNREKGAKYFDLIKFPNLHFSDLSRRYQNFLITIQYLFVHPKSPFHRIPKDVLDHQIIPFISESSVIFSKEYFQIKLGSLYPENAESLRNENFNENESKRLLTVKSFEENPWEVLHHAVIIRTKIKGRRCSVRNVRWGENREEEYRVDNTTIVICNAITENVVTSEVREGRVEERQLRKPIQDLFVKLISESVMEKSEKDFKEYIARATIGDRAGPTTYMRKYGCEGDVLLDTLVELMAILGYLETYTEGGFRLINTTFFWKSLREKIERGQKSSTNNNNKKKNDDEEETEGEGESDDADDADDADDDEEEEKKKYSKSGGVHGFPLHPVFLHHLLYLIKTCHQFRRCARSYEDLEVVNLLITLLNVVDNYVESFEANHVKDLFSSVFDDASIMNLFHDFVRLNFPSDEGLGDALMNVFLRFCKSKRFVQILREPRLYSGKEMWPLTLRYMFQESIVHILAKEHFSISSHNTFIEAMTDEKTGFVPNHLFPVFPEGRMRGAYNKGGMKGMEKLGSQYLYHLLMHIHVEKFGKKFLSYLKSEFNGIQFPIEHSDGIIIYKNANQCIVDCLGRLTHMCKGQAKKVFPIINSVVQNIRYRTSIWYTNSNKSVYRNFFSEVIKLVSLWVDIAIKENTNVTEMYDENNHRSNSHIHSVRNIVRECLTCKLEGGYDVSELHSRIILDSYNIVERIVSEVPKESISEEMWKSFVEIKEEFRSTYQKASRILESTEDPNKVLQYIPLIESYIKKKKEDIEEEETMKMVEMVGFVLITYFRRFDREHILSFQLEEEFSKVWRVWDSHSDTITKVLLEVSFVCPRKTTEEIHDFILIIREKYFDENEFSSLIKKHLPILLEKEKQEEVDITNIFHLAHFVLRKPSLRLLSPDLVASLFKSSLSWLEMKLSENKGSSFALPKYQYSLYELYFKLKEEDVPKISGELVSRFIVMMWGNILRKKIQNKDEIDDFLRFFEDFIKDEASFLQKAIIVIRKDYTNIRLWDPLCCHFITSLVTAYLSNSITPNHIISSFSFVDILNNLLSRFEPKRDRFEIYDPYTGHCSVPERYRERNGDKKVAVADAVGRHDTVELEIVVRMFATQGVSDLIWRSFGGGNFSRVKILTTGLRNVYCRMKKSAFLFRIRILRALLAFKPELFFTDPKIWDNSASNLRKAYDFFSFPIEFHHFIIEVLRFYRDNKILGKMLIEGKKNFLKLFDVRRDDTYTTDFDVRGYLQNQERDMVLSVQDLIVFGVDPFSLEVRE